VPATVTIDKPSSIGYLYGQGNKIRRGTLQLGTYVTNGVAVTPAMFGLHSLDELHIEDSYVNGEIYAWDKANAKVKAYSAVGTEQTQIDISANLARFRAYGR
jgi:hypothetical protein